jgi:hypothetical protein
LAKRLAGISSAINFCEIYVFLVKIQLIPGRCKILAVTTPRSIKFNEPRFGSEDFITLSIDY